MAAPEGIAVLPLELLLHKSRICADSLWICSWICSCKLLLGGQQGSVTERRDGVAVGEHRSHLCFCTSSNCAFCCAPSSWSALLSSGGGDMGSG